MNIAKMLPPSKGVSTAFIAGDWHTNALDMPTYNVLKKHALTLPPEMRNLIINGDFLDAPHLMKRGDGFSKWFKRSDGIDEYFLPLSEQEFQWGNEILDDLQGTFKEIVFIFGNHDWRYGWFKEQISPAYAHNFDVISQLKLNKRKIDYVHYNDWLDWGDNLSITHGMYHGSTCHKKHYEASGGKSVIFSHVHYYGCHSYQVRGDTRQVHSLPAMCHLNPEYIKNAESNWSNGYGFISMRPDSRFNFNVFQLWNKELILPSGEILKGN